jgi:hypothetical protein
MPEPPAGAFHEPAAVEITAAQPAPDVMQQQLITDVDAAMVEAGPFDAQQQEITGLEVIVFV